MRITSRIGYEIDLAPIEMISVTSDNGIEVKVDRIKVRHIGHGNIVVSFDGWWKPDVHADTKHYSSPVLVMSKVPPELKPILDQLEGGSVTDQHLEHFLAGQ